MDFPNNECSTGATPKTFVIVFCLVHDPFNSPINNQISKIICSQISNKIFCQLNSIVFHHVDITLTDYTNLWNRQVTMYEQRIYGRDMTTHCAVTSRAVFSPPLFMFRYNYDGSLMAWIPNINLNTKYSESQEKKYLSVKIYIWHEIPNISKHHFNLQLSAEYFTQRCSLYQNVIMVPLWRCDRSLSAMK